MNILNFKDDTINFRFIAVDDLGNTKTLTDSSFWFIKDFDNHKDFAIQYLDETFLYSLDQDHMIDLTVKIIPFDNDITSVALITDHEFFNLTNQFIEDDHIYFSDEILEDIKLNATFYNILPGEFKSIPLTLWFYQDETYITHKSVNILVTDTIFADSVNISNIEFDSLLLPPNDNVWMSFTTGTNTYRNYLTTSQFYYYPHSYLTVMELDYFKHSFYFLVQFRNIF